MRSRRATAEPVCCTREPRLLRPEHDDVLAIAGATETFNPTIDPELIAKARDEDVESSEAEWSGGWRRDIAAFLSDRDIEAAVDYDQPAELPPDLD